MVGVTKYVEIKHEKIAPKKKKAQRKGGENGSTHCIVLILHSKWQTVIS